MATTITFGNFKGGTGKTSNSCMISYLLSERGYKTLLIDMDPQGNATALFLKTKQKVFTKEVIKFDKTLMSAISDNDLQPIITNIKENLDIIPSYVDFTSFPIYLEKEYPDDLISRAMEMDRLLTKIKPYYDFILIDVPPTVSVYTDNALMTSDFTVIVMQTQERSLDGAKAYINYLQELITNYNADFDILGILPVLLKNSSNVDKAILKSAHIDFGKNNMFSELVKNMERIKRYDITGITDPKYYPNHDVHDKNVFNLYNNVVDEFLERLEDKKHGK